MRNCAAFSIPPPTASSRSPPTARSAASAPRRRRFSAIASPRSSGALRRLFAPESRKILRDYLAALQGPGLASVFNDGREVTAIVKQGGEVPLFLTIGKLQPKRPRKCRFLRGGARYHAMEEDRTGIARGQGNRRSRQAGRSRNSSPRSAMNCARRSTPSSASRK